MRVLFAASAGRTRPDPPRGRRVLRVLAALLVLAALGSLVVPAAATPTGQIEPRPCASAPCAAPSLLPDAPIANLSWVRLHHDDVVPTARTGAALVADPAAGGVLLFGGCGPSQCPMNDTWWYSHGTWTNLTAQLAVAPPGRWGAAAAYDPSSGGVLLFGGCTSNGPLDDAWLYLNGSWSALPTGAPWPVARCAAAASTDPGEDGAVLFGGSSGSGSALDDLWLFSNGSFHLLPQGGTRTPVARSGASLTFDAGTGALLLYGGTTASGGLLGDLWAYSDGSWSADASGGLAPAPRANATFVYDPAVGGDLLFGGSGASGVLGDTWSFENGTWSNLSATLGHAPAPHAEAASTYDGVDGYLLLQGGLTTGGAVRNDTWALVQPLATSIVLPYGALAPNEVLRFAAAPSGGVPPYHENWTFGDGSPFLRGVAPTHEYATPGNYTVRLEVNDLRGTFAYANLTLAIFDTPLHVLLTVTPSVVTLGSAATLAATVTGGLPPYTYQWSGLPSGCASADAPALSCHPDALGSFAVSVAVTDAAGNGSAAGAPLTVAAVPAATTTAAAPSIAAGFARFGWLLLPPLVAALIWAAFTSSVAYRGVRNFPPPATPAERPECYVPPEWSETPPAYAPAPADADAARPPDG